MGNDISTFAREEAGDAGYLIKQGNTRAPGMLMLSEIDKTQGWSLVDDMLLSTCQQSSRLIAE